jgi:D-serine deaminase-like pyridoxal phosphate-dependent protein
MTTLDDLLTPALVLDRARLDRNLAAMSARMKAHGVALRPHLKTAKSAEVARRAVAGNFGGITVSTVAEAAYFAAEGFRDITYAVGMVAAKMAPLAALMQDGVRLTLLSDDPGGLAALDEAAGALGVRPGVLVEIDTGLGRAGVAPDAPEMVAMGRAIEGAANLDLAGVLTHAGHSYHCRNNGEIRAVAEAERAGLVEAADRLSTAGLPCPTVSAGSTPTATFAERLDGVTEMRPGNYVFYDLDQVGIGSCTVNDVAVSVLASVIGHNRARGTVLIDAGALALSKDVSAGEFFDDAGYGWVFDAEGRERVGGAWVVEVHQEHGIVSGPGGEPAPFDALPVGARVRVLPNHSCITCAMYGSYHVVEGGRTIVGEWPRVNGWQASAPAP